MAAKHYPAIHGWANAGPQVRLPRIRSDDSRAAYSVSGKVVLYEVYEVQICA